MDDLIKRIRLAHTILLLTCAVLFYALEPQTQELPIGYKALIDMRDDMAQLNTDDFKDEIVSELISDDPVEPKALRYPPSRSLLRSSSWASEGTLQSRGSRVEKPENSEDENQPDDIRKSLVSISGISQEMMYHVENISSINSSKSIRELIEITSSPIEYRVFSLPNKIKERVVRYQSPQEQHDNLLSAYTNQAYFPFLPNLSSGSTFALTKAMIRERIVGRKNIYYYFSHRPILTYLPKTPSYTPLTDEELEVVSRYGIYRLLKKNLEYRHLSFQEKGSFILTVTTLNLVPKESEADTKTVKIKPASSISSVLDEKEVDNSLGRPEIPSENALPLITDIKYKSSKYFLSDHSVTYEADIIWRQYTDLVGYNEDLLSLDSRLLDFTLEEAISALKGHIAGNLNEDELEFLGLRVKKRHADIVAPLLLAVLLGYLFLAISELCRREKLSPGAIAACDVAWIGVFPSMIARAAVLVSLAAFPPFVVGYLYWANSGQDWTHIHQGLFAILSFLGLAAGFQLIMCYGRRAKKG